MLGEKVLEHSGKVTSQRVLPAEGGAPRVETSFEASEKVLGVEAKTTATYQGAARPDGTFYGQGQGLVMTKDGDLATWIGHGSGRPKAGGAVSWRGSIIYQTSSQKLARLSGMVVVFEYEVDAGGNTTGTGWEWK